MNAWLRRIGGYFFASIVLLAGWQLLSMAVGSQALPGPVPALSDFFRLFFSDLLPHAGISAWRVVASMVIGAAIAAPLGLAIGRSPKVDAIAAPMIFLTYPVPKVVFLPVLLVLLGIGNLPKIALITLIVFFQILVTARDAARGIPASAVLSVRSLGATRWQVFRHVVVPASLPDIFTALRISTGTAIAVLFFSETVAGSEGLGYYIIDAWSRIAYSEMFAGIIAMALLGVVLYEFLELAEGRVCRWTRAER
ncbi:MAG: ABC transporter permease [Actinobacteria bacterium HGW-Actinobacteria-6]|jgi:NitT/TauT family transport system permease protein|nr:MAG: ABC transporter permease [Actinobacteria bacterium HGW-Actinobacteria-6]